MKQASPLVRFPVCTGTPRVCLETISALKVGVDDLSRDYLFATRSFQRDLLALRFYLGEADFAFILNNIWTSPNEAKFKWWDTLKLWVSRKIGGDLTA